MLQINNLLIEFSETEKIIENSADLSSTSALSSSNNFEYELKLFNQSEKLRKSFFSKLILTKTWQPSIKEKKYNSLIIFDWDDTLLCTSYLTPSGVFNEDFKLSVKDKEKISKIEYYVLKILNYSITKGDTYIITNASTGWVEYSCEKFYPNVYKILKNITIISARGEYEKFFPNESRKWKIQAFLEMKNNFNTESNNL